MMITKNVPYWKPTKSQSNPETDGPTKAPSANDEDHSPETKPQLVRSSGNPAALKHQRSYVVLD